MKKLRITLARRNLFILDGIFMMDPIYEMMKKTLPFAGLLLIFFLFIACDKINDDVSGDVELFLLESFETIDQTCAIDISSVLTENKPLISYSDFKSYNSKEYIFKISDKGQDAIKNLEHSVTGLAFAIVADKNLIYTGYFWPSYSSASCQCLVIDPMMVQRKNELHLVLGYPGPFEGITIPDKRNDQLILDIFKRDKKLID